jgi:hypothetical protein
VTKRPHPNVKTGPPTLSRWINDKTGATWWEINVRAVPASLNVKLRSHFGAARKEQEKWFWLLRSVSPGIPDATGVRKITFIRHGHGLLDDDNLAAAYKEIRDLLRPPKAEQGVYGPGTKKAGQTWVKRQLGLSLTLGDGPGQALFVYQQERVGTKIQPWTTIYVEDAL